MQVEQTGVSSTEFANDSIGRYCFLNMHHTCVCLCVHVLCINQMHTNIQTCTIHMMHICARVCIWFFLKYTSHMHICIHTHIHNARTGAGIVSNISHFAASQPGIQPDEVTGTKRLVVQNLQDYMKREDSGRDQLNMSIGGHSKENAQQDNDTDIVMQASENQSKHADAEPDDARTKALASSAEDASPLVDKGRRPSDTATGLSGVSKQPSARLHPKIVEILRERQ